MPHLSALQRIGGVVLFFVQALRWSVRAPFPLRESIRMMRILGARCVLPVISVVGPIGAVIALQSMKVLDSFGTHRLLSPVLAVTILRELSPVLCSVMVAAQAGSSIAAELGAMRVKEEIDAMEVMAVHPMRQLVVPRLVAGMLVTPMLHSLASAAGILGGYILAVLVKGMDAGDFTGNVFLFIRPADIWSGLMKTAVFGLIVSAISCAYGFGVTGGAEGVGKAANDAVVHSVVMIIGANYLLTTMLFS